MNARCESCYKVFSKSDVIPFNHMSCFDNPDRPCVGKCPQCHGHCHESDAAISKLRIRIKIDVEYDTHGKVHAEDVRSALESKLRGEIERNLLEHGSPVETRFEHMSVGVRAFDDSY